MVAPTISHLICSGALIILIVVMPLFYVNVVNNVNVEMRQRELKEVADYVSNTIGNLYVLVNSTNTPNVSLEKDMMYLPYTVEDSIFIVKIDSTGGNVTRILTYLKENPSVSADSWIGPGLSTGTQTSVESNAGRIIAGCGRNATAVSVWIRHQ